MTVVQPRERMIRDAHEDPGHVRDACETCVILAALDDARASVALVGGAVEAFASTGPASEDWDDGQWDAFEVMGTAVAAQQVLPGAPLVERVAAALYLRDPASKSVTWDELVGSGDARVSAFRQAATTLTNDLMEPQPRPSPVPIERIVAAARSIPGRQHHHHDPDA